MSNAELATSYAALILADDGVEITVRIPRHPERIGNRKAQVTDQFAGRQAPDPHQGRQDRGRRAHLDNPLRQGTRNLENWMDREQYLIGITGS